MDPRPLTLALLGISGGLVEAYGWLRLTLRRLRDRIDVAYFGYQHNSFRASYKKIIADFLFDLFLLGKPSDAHSVTSLDCWVNHSKEDLFSKLPDDIISFIMSRLSSREAVRLSILSKRLRRIYASLPNLNFDSFAFFIPLCDNKFIEIDSNPHFCICATHELVRIVDRSLRNYPCPKILSFRISFCYRRQYARNVDQWISWAIKMGVERLDLEFVCFDSCCCEEYYDYTNSKMYEFTCERLCEVPFSLKLLRLHSCILLPHPITWKFTTLTTLDLNYISLIHGKLYHMLSSCVNLEWLGLRKCTLPHKVQISGLLSLEFLSIDSCNDVEEIELSAVNLTTFELADMAAQSLLLSCVPKLKNIHLSSIERKLDQQYILSTLAVDLPQIQMLTFFLPPRLRYMPGTFSNVVQLNLFVMMEEENYDFAQNIIPLLGAFPFLQKLYLKLPSPFGRYQEGWTGDIRPPPSAGLFRPLLPELREVYFAEFQGTKKHTESVVWVLENAVSLELMTIDAADIRYCSGKWHSYPYFSNAASFESNTEVVLNLLRRRNNSNTKVIVQRGKRGEFVTRELIARV